MPLQSSGPISLNDIAGEFGGTTPHSLSEYYGVDTGVPASGIISFSDFYGTSAAPSIGDAYEGGYYAGMIDVNGAGIGTHYLIVIEKDKETQTQYKTTNSASTNAQSLIYGGTATAANNDSNHPAFQYCAGLTHNTYSDWYLPSLYELAIIYYNLKPSTNNNFTTNGANPYSVPVRNSNYTTSNPGQTSVSVFQTGGAQAFETATGTNYNRYITSTELSSSTGRCEHVRFNTGEEDDDNKVAIRSVRAIRRVAIP